MLPASMRNDNYLSPSWAKEKLGLGEKLEQFIELGENINHQADGLFLING